MKFKQLLFLGFSATPLTLTYRSGSLPISENDIEVAADYAGSCHILKMGLHYAEYVADGKIFPAFSVMPEFPKTSPLRQLEGKTRAANVTGNIGEIVAGITAQRTLGFETSGIAHLKVQGNNKTPDYLLYRTKKFRKLLSRLHKLALVERRRLPLWWLMESKARTEPAGGDCLKAAFKQLALFWFRMRGDYPQGVGYGIVVVTTLQRKRSIHIHIFIPKSRAALLAYFDLFPDEDHYRLALDAAYTDTAQFLY